MSLTLEYFNILESIKNLTIIEKECLKVEIDSIIERDLIFGKVEKEKKSFFNRHGVDFDLKNCDFIEEFSSWIPLKMLPNEYSYLYNKKCIFKDCKWKNENCECECECDYCLHLECMSCKNCNCECEDLNECQIYRLKCTTDIFVCGNCLNRRKDILSMN